ncbi:DUF6147 family protein [Bacillaceae bacterium S4-13-56]
MKKRLIFVISFLLFILNFPSGMSVMAEGDEKPAKPSIGIESQDPYYGEGSIGDVFLKKDGSYSTLSSTQYLKYGTSSIEIIGTSAFVVGKSGAYYPVDKVEVEVYLQIWDSSVEKKWVDISYIGTFSNYNDSVASGGSYVSLISGYYYRTRSRHAVTHGSDTETATSYSSYLWYP